MRFQAEKVLVEVTAPVIPVGETVVFGFDRVESGAGVEASGGMATLESGVALGAGVAFEKTEGAETLRPGLKLRAKLSARESAGGVYHVVESARVVRARRSVHDGWITRARRYKSYWELELGGFRYPCRVPFGTWRAASKSRPRPDMQIEVAGAMDASDGLRYFYATEVKTLAERRSEGRRRRYVAASAAQVDWEDDRSGWLVSFEGQVNACYIDDSLGVGQVRPGMEMRVGGKMGRDTEGSKVFIASSVEALGVESTAEPVEVAVSVGAAPDVVVTAGAVA